MRKLVALELVSLDGVMESPKEWAFSYSDDEMERENAAGMAASDALLLGRATYEEFASFWPYQPGGTQMVDYINSVRKYVVSTTLEEPLGWNNSALIGGDIAKEIDTLKRAARQEHHDHGQYHARPVADKGRPPRRASSSWCIPWFWAAGSDSSRTEGSKKSWSS